MRYLIYIIYSRKYIDIEIIEFFKYFYIYAFSKNFTGEIKNSKILENRKLKY